jgi:hypothetical protein
MSVCNVGFIIEGSASFDRQIFGRSRPVRIVRKREVAAQRTVDVFDCG